MAKTKMKKRRSAKGLTTIELVTTGIIAGIIAVILIVQVAKFTQTGMKFSDSSIKNLKKDCENVMNDWGISNQDKVSGEMFWRTVSKCGFCIQKLTDGEYEYYVDDMDDDGIPDKCEPKGKELFPPANKEDLKKHCAGIMSPIKLRCCGSGAGIFCK